MWDDCRLQMSCTVLEKQLKNIHDDKFIPKYSNEIYEIIGINRNNKKKQIIMMVK